MGGKNLFRGGLVSSDQTKGLMAKPLYDGLITSDAERLRATYQIQSFVLIMIPNPSAKDSDPPSEG